MSEPEVDDASVREWTETLVYILTAAITTYAVLHQAGVEIDLTAAKKRLAKVRARLDRVPWVNPRLWRKMVTEVLLEAWNVVEGVDRG